jgi:hypothetical protein
MMISPWFHEGNGPFSGVPGEGWHAGVGQGKRRLPPERAYAVRHPSSPGDSMLAIPAQSAQKAQEG